MTKWLLYEMSINFFNVKGSKNYQLGTGYFVHHRIVSAVKRVEFVYLMCG